MNNILNFIPKVAVRAVLIIAFFGTILPVSAESSESSCYGLTGCDRKICEKEKALQVARQYNDISKIIGIQDSLVHLRESCAKRTILTKEEYDTELKELKREYKEDLAEALEDYDDDVRKAKTEGKKEKIDRAMDKYKSKIREAADKYERKLKALKAEGK